MTKKLSIDKSFAEHGKKQKHKAMKEAKLTRRKRAKESGDLPMQKQREKAYNHMRKHGG